MSINANFRTGFSGGSAPSFNDQTTKAAATVIEHDMAVAGTTANQLLTTAWVAANAVGIYISSAIDLTIKTNSSGSPAETITIKASTPFQWLKDSGVVNPFATNVTALYVTPGGSTPGTLSVRVATS